MKKMKNLSFVMIFLLVSVFTMKNVHAAGWASTLDMPFGTIHNGRTRNYGSGEHFISISVDGFNMYDSSVLKSGSTKMEMDLNDAATSRALKRDSASYTYGTCVRRSMGTHSAGKKYYTFYSAIGNEFYSGVKSNAVYMYPLP